MQIGICTSVDQAATLREVGVDFIEENVGGLLCPLQPEESFAPNLIRVQASPLPVLTANCFLPGTLKCTGPAVDVDAIAAFAETTFRRAALAGLKNIVFGSGGARQVPEGFSRETAFVQFVAVLKRLGPIAGEHGIRIVVEPLCRGDCNFLNTLDEGLAAVKACNHPQVGLLADIYHMTRNGETPDAITRCGSLLWYMHIAENAKRTAPGVAGDDFRPFLRALRQTGYDYVISLECSDFHMPGDAPAAVRELRRQLADVGY